MHSFHTAKWNDLNLPDAMNMDDWEAKLNEYGLHGTPFFFMIDFEMRAPLVFTLDQLPSGVQYSMPDNTRTKHHPLLVDDEKLIFERFPISFEEFQSKFELVHQSLHYGNSFLLNLCFRTPVKCNLPLEEIFRRASAKYKLLFHEQFVCFSPETFVTIRDGVIRSFPMKGTISADVPNAEQVLLADKKELAEHYTIVDLLRNDLSMVASEVHVPKFRYLDLLQTNRGALYQMSSIVEGKLSVDHLSQLGTILRKLLPAGSISGAPKPKTVEIIREAEMIDRGYYTGIFGVFDGNNFDSAVMIRFLEREADGSLYYRSGCGITAQSQAASEFDEYLKKIYVPIS